MKPSRRRIHVIIDAVCFSLVFPAAILLKYVRRIGVDKLPACRWVLNRIGVFPIRNHYYEPKFVYRKDEPNREQARTLPGIDWQAEEQVAFLSNLTFSDELKDIPAQKNDALRFHFNNGFFESGDMEYWYQLIRYQKPARIVEIGSGYSTLAAIDAIAKNMEQDANYRCQHTCIEPYEKPWLENTQVQVIRKTIQEIDWSLFTTLEQGDILFIDSSHIIRPGGDVLIEYLQLLPNLPKGVIVHIHDIFSPNDYPDSWLKDRVFFWNEQYLLEAFLTHNRDWKIVGGLNYLHKNHYDKLLQVAPYLTPDREPGSFYIQKIRRQPQDSC